MNDFLQRLQQRKLVQWALAYVAFAFALIQVLDVVAQRFAWPDSIERVLIVALAIGFFVVLVLAWYHGERGAQRVNGTELLILALLLAIGGGLLWRFAAAPAGGPDAAQRIPGKVIPDFAAGAAASGLRIATAQAVAVPAKSVAVLPLSNESGDKDQQYFSDGLSEDLITALSQFAGLKVISRNSSFQFRDSRDSSSEIGAKLGVAHLLEGTVQRAGDAVRISATLVKAVDGSTLWSQHYDRSYKDLFALQDDITHQVADALKAKLLSDREAVPQSDRPPSGNLDAWNAYSRGEYRVRLGGEADLHQAIDYFNQAVARDPRYARAYAAAANAGAFLASIFQSGEEGRQTLATARAQAERALQLDPNLAAAHVARGLLLQWADFDWAGAQAEYRRALELAPNDSLSMFRVGTLAGTLGDPQRSIALIRQTIVADPRNGGSHYWLAWTLAAVGQLDEAEWHMRKTLELAPGSPTSYSGLAMILVQRGEPKAALATAMQTSPGMWRDLALTFALQAGDDRAATDAALQSLIAKYAEALAYQIAEVYALRRDPDNVFKWLDRAWTNRDPGISRLLTDPFILRFQNDPRFAAFCKKVGLPTTTEAKAMP